MIDVPKSWSRATLEALFEVILGGDWGKDPEDIFDGSVAVRCIRAAELRDWQTEKGRTAALRRIAGSSLEKRRLRTGDILVEVSGGGPDQPVGRTVLITSAVLNSDKCHEFVCTNFFRFCRPVSGIEPAYLNWYLSHFYSTGGTRELQGGSNNLRNLRFPDYAAQTVPIAPLNEQRRIVAKIEELLSELDKGVESLTTAREQLKTYRQSVLKVAFEGKLTEDWRKKDGDRCEPVEQLIERISQPPRPNRWNSRTTDVILGHPALAVGNPKTKLPDGWRWCQLADIARMESGHTPSRERAEWWGGDVAWIGIADARENDGRVIHETFQHTNPDGLANSAARLLPAGTVCISRTASVGYVVVMGKSMATSQDFVNWTPTEAVTSDWLRIVFGADKESLRRFGKGTVHKTIYFPEWLSIHIALPPLEEQKVIVDEVDKLLSSIEYQFRVIDEAMAQAVALRQSILKRAFCGQLVPQDPADEPASVLLARIRAEQEESSTTKRRNNKNNKEAA